MDATWIQSLIKLVLKKAWFLFVLIVIFVCLLYNDFNLHCFYRCEQNLDNPGLPSPVKFPTIQNGNINNEIGSKIENDRIISSECVANLSHYDNRLFKHPDEEVAKTNKDLKFILTMVGNYGYKDFGFGYGSDPFRSACCKQSNCYLTDNRQLMPVDQFDAIIFHFRTMLSSDFPNKRSAHQKYIMFDMEPSGYVYQNPQIYDGIFNLTWNFRQDADITLRYGRVLPYSLINGRPSKGPDIQVTNDAAEGKTGLVTWFVSRCSSVSWREHFVESMQNYIQIDVYGECGTMTCSTARFNQCYKMAEKKYKFYLSFENSLCKDYITEKFFNILRYNMVPIVYGAGDYSSFAPPKSYINVLDFKDTLALADYLLYLDNNSTAYNEYFKWKDDYFVPSEWTNHALNLCSLCQKMHEKTSVPSVYDDLTDYFVTKAQCTRVSPILWWERWFSS